MGSAASAPKPAAGAGSAIGDYGPVAPAGLHIIPRGPDEASLTAEVRELHDAYDADLTAAQPTVLPQGLGTRTCFSAVATAQECAQHGGTYGPVATHPLLRALAAFGARVAQKTAAVQKKAERVTAQLAVARLDLLDLQTLLKYVRSHVGRASDAQAVLATCQERVKTVAGELATAQSELDAISSAPTPTVSSSFTGTATATDLPTALSGGDSATAYRLYQALVDAPPLPRQYTDAPACLRTYPAGAAEDANFAKARAAGFACAPTLFGLQVLGPFTRGLRKQLAEVTAAHAAQEAAHTAIDAALADMTAVRAQIQAALAAAGLPPDELVTLTDLMHKTRECTDALNTAQERVVGLRHATRAAAAAAAAARTAAARAQADAIAADAEAKAKAKAKEEAEAKATEAPVSSPAPAPVPVPIPVPPAQAQVQPPAPAPTATEAVATALASASAADKATAAASLLDMIKAVVADADAGHVAADLDVAATKVAPDLVAPADLAAQNVLFLRNFSDAFFAAVFTAPDAPEVKDKDAYFKRADVQGVMLRDAKKRRLIVYTALLFDGVAALVATALVAYMESAGMRRLRA